MRRWGPGFDWDHLQNGVILLVVVAANSPIQTTSRPPELPPSQSAAVASNDTPAPSQRAPPQTPAVTDKAAIRPRSRWRYR